MGPKFGAQKGNKLGSQLGPMSITKLSPNWACQMGPIHCINFLLSGSCTSMLNVINPMRPTCESRRKKKQMQTQTTCTMDRQCKGGHRINWTDIEGYHDNSSTDI